MGRCVVKLAPDKYVEWSSIVDAPVTCVLTRAQMVTHLNFRYGFDKRVDIVDRMQRADTFGTSLSDESRSNYGTSTEEFIRGNRAGPNETEIRLDEIITKYEYEGIKPNVD